MNLVIRSAARRTRIMVGVVALLTSIAGCGDSGGSSSDGTAASVAPAASAADTTGATTSTTAAPTTAAATTAAPTTAPVTTAVPDTVTVESTHGTDAADTLPATTLPAPTTVAPPATDPPTTATTAPPAPSTTAAPIVIGGLTLATCIASEMFGETMTQPRAEVALYQYTLRGLGYDPGAIDGYFGARTMEAAAYEVMDHTTDNAGLFVDEGVIYQDVFIRLGLAC